MAVSPYVYRPAPGWNRSQDAEFREREAHAPESGAASVATLEPENPHPVEDIEQHEKQAWEQGFREGAAQAHTETEGAVNHQREAVADALREFLRDRDAYFHHVEGEVVSLALAIVRKILRREAQVDPLLLSGLVRVALEKMAVSQNIRLRVHPLQISEWRNFFSQQTGLPAAPELIGDAALEQDQCRLETELGVTDLNLDTHLKEIEQGLFDLLAQRPAPH